MHQNFLDQTFSEVFFGMRDYGHAAVGVPVFVMAPAHSDQPESMRFQDFDHIPAVHGRIVRIRVCIVKERVSTRRNSSRQSAIAQVIG